MKSRISGATLATKHVQTVTKQRTLPSAAQWRELPRFLSAREKLRAKLSLAVLGIASVTLGIYFWNTSLVRVPALGGSITEGLIGSPRYINPLFSEGSDADRDLTRLVFRGLTQASANGYVADLAAEIISESPTVTRVVIKPEAKFHNGQPLTSSDVLFTIEAIKNPSFGSPLLPLYQEVSVEADGDGAVRFTAKEGLDILPLLAVGILPADVWQSVPPESAILSSLNLRPVGNGPYQVSKLTRNEDGEILSLTLTAFQDYPGDGPYIKNIVAKFAPTANALGEALLAGQLDSAATVPASKAEKLQNDRRFNIVTPNMPQYVAAYFNTKKSVFTESAVRRALALAIDRAQVAAQARSSFATAWPSPVLPYFATDLEVTTPGADLEGARAALEGAGWITGPDGIRLKGEERLAFSVTAVESEEFAAAAEAIAQSWRSVGAEVTVQNVSRVSFQQAVAKDRAFDVLIADAQYLGSRPDPYIFWHSSQGVAPGLSISQIANSALDAAVSAIRKNESPEIVKEAYKAFNAAFMEEAPAVILYVPQYIYAAPSEVKGLNLNWLSTPADRFQGILNWYVTTKNVRRQH